MTPEVTREVAKALFRKLAALRGYPPVGPGEDHFIDMFQMACISVEHAKAIVLSFDGIMPTIREIRECAYSLRPRFESTVSAREQWERDCGPPKPFDVTVKAPEGERRIDAVWRELRREFPGCGTAGKRWPALPELAKKARALGYDDIARAWERF